MRLSAAIAAVLISGCSSGAPAKPDIAVRDAWARATAPGQTAGAAYLTIVNRGGAGDRLLGVAASEARMAMLHGSDERDGVVSMRMLGALDVPAGGSVSLAPLGNHVMLTGLAAPLRVGERLDLTLRFERSGTRTVAAEIVPAGAAGPTK